MWQWHEKSNRRMSSNISNVRLRNRKKRRNNLIIAEISYKNTKIEVLNITYESKISNF